ncbi:Crp/Fnr family transcriptional regulator [Parapedobacter indicus]|uniref:cAMP-binding domain of CRP or a regulatory subunit of cAMP-dependent protein kinases n=1 Tax=Parapedobacter indicus TaxID=1477437 RepID=A0A1I3CLD2_9SPHI|nr:Crp/Fnr family transcriptional regulator [Parapedobacter indicus]PPL04303.1 CRP-like cAMP-binding protein [Parapedobacter indicus]SFH75380.1 cAMP-binding domain of CRP or a regulatory subunit of cAMP-dependent protein kinases [Parapedobacter indicus]
MNRFINYIHQRIPLSAPAKAFIRRHSRVLVYDRFAHFMTPEVRMPYWCVVLDGLACGYTLDADGQRHIRWFAKEMQGFAGLRHLYTPKQAEHYIQFTEVTTILCIRASHMREGKERFTEVSELLHLMNQRYKERQDKLINVLQQTLAYDRYVRFLTDFPELAKRITPEQQMDFINIARPTYFRVQKQYLTDK